MSEDTNQKLFEAIVSAGLYLEYGARQALATQERHAGKFATFLALSLAKAQNANKRLTQPGASFSKKVTSRIGSPPRVWGKHPCCKYHFP